MLLQRAPFRVHVAASCAGEQEFCDSYQAGNPARVQSVLPARGFARTARGVPKIGSNHASGLVTSTSLISNSQGHGFPVTNSLSFDASCVGMTPPGTQFLSAGDTLTCMMKVE